MNLKILVSGLACAAAALTVTVSQAQAPVDAELPVVPGAMPECIERCMVLLPCPWDSEPLLDVAAPCAELLRACEAECGVFDNLVIPEP